MYIVVTGVYVCLSVCMYVCVCPSDGALLRYCTYFNIALANGWEYPLAVRLEIIIFKSVLELCCYGNIHEPEHEYVSECL